MAFVPEPSAEVIDVDALPDDTDSTRQQTPQAKTKVYVQLDPSPSWVKKDMQRSAGVSLFRSSSPEV
jgi:hypothetical protein